MFFNLTVQILLRTRGRHRCKHHRIRYRGRLRLTTTRQISLILGFRSQANNRFGMVLSSLSIDILSTSEGFYLIFFSISFISLFFFFSPTCLESDLALYKYDTLIHRMEQRDLFQEIDDAVFYFLSRCFFPSCGYQAMYSSIYYHRVLTPVPAIIHKLRSQGFG